MNVGSARGDTLVQALLLSEKDNGEASDDLLREFQRGYPVRHLARLLTSDREVAVGAGAFIAAEMGQQVLEVLDEVLNLSAHRSPGIRSDVIQAIAGAQRVAPPQAIAAGVRGLVDDDERGSSDGCRGDRG